MPEEVRESLVEATQLQFDAIQACQPGSEEAKNAVKNAVMLYELALQEAKIDNEYTEMSERIQDERRAREKENYLRQKELELKEQELNEKKVSRRCEVGVGIAGIIVPVAFYAVWMDRGFEFEKKGVFTSSVFRGLANNFNRLIKLR